ALARFSSRARWSDRRRSALETTHRSTPDRFGARDVESCYASVLSPSRVAMGREQVMRLELAFDALPGHYREVVTLARVAGLSYEQIATATGRSVDSVRNILARALNKLASLLEEEEEP